MNLNNAIALAVKETAITKVNHVIVEIKSKKGDPKYRYTMEKFWKGDPAFRTEFKKTKVVVYDKKGKVHKNVDIKKQKPEKPVSESQKASKTEDK